jgi:hypothetical protein
MTYTLTPVPESLILVIKYRSLREGGCVPCLARVVSIDNVFPEVECLIESFVERTIADLPSLTLHREVLVNDLIKSLDNTTWIELYSATGELNFPDLQNEGELGQVLQKVKQVCESPSGTACPIILIFIELP